MSQTQDARTLTMERAPIPKAIMTLAVPAIVGMLVGSVYNMSDTFFVSRLGTAAVAAVGITFPVMAVIWAVGLAFGVGGASFISRLLGAGQKDRAESVLMTSLISSFVAAGMLALLAGLLLDPILKVAGATPTILPHAERYLVYILLSAPFQSVTMTISHCLRAEGSSFQSMLGSLVGAAINIALDPLFIFTFRLGVAGAAIATALSQVISLGVFLLPYLRGKSVLRLRPRAAQFKAWIYLEVLKIGAPSATREFLSSASMLLLNNAAMVYGDAPLAALSIGGKISWFCFSLLIGFSQGFAPVAGYNFGAKKPERMWQALWFAVIAGTVYTAATCGLMALFAPQLIAFFQDDPEVVRLGALALRLGCIATPFQAWVVIVNTQFQAMGRGIPASVIALTRQGLCLIPIILILPRVLGLFGVLACQPAADMLSLIVAVPFAVGLIRQMRRLRQDWAQPVGEIWEG